MSIDIEFIPVPDASFSAATYSVPLQSPQFSTKIVPIQTFEVESNNYYLAEKTFKEEIFHLSAYLPEFKKPKIKTPFKGTGMVMSKDRTKFYFGSREGRIGVAKIETKETIGDVDLKEGTIRAIALSHNDRFLYSGGEAGEIKKFLVNSMTQINVFRGHTDEVNMILISKDETKMYSAANDGKVLVWDLTVNEGLSRILYSIVGKCYGLDLSADGQFLASVGADRCLHFYDLVNDYKIKVVSENDFGLIWCVTVTYSNTYVAFGDDKGTTYVYLVKTWERSRVFKGHIGRVKCIVSTTDDRYVITGGTDHIIIIWDLSETRNGIELMGHDAWIKALVISDDQRSFYSMSDDCSIRSWRIPKADNYFILKENFSMSGFNKILTGHKSTDFIFLMSNDSITRLERLNSSSLVLDMSELKVKLFCINPIDDKILTVRFDENHLFYSKSAIKKYVFESYNSNFLKLREHVLEFYDLSSMIYSPDGQFIILGEMFKCVILYEDTLEVYHEFLSHQGSVTNLACSPSMKYLFSFDDSPINSMIKAYSFPKQLELKALIDPNFIKVAEMEISPDDEYLVVVPENRQATIWATSKMIKISDFNITSCIDVKFHNHHNHLYCLFPKQIKTFILPSMCVCFVIKFTTPARVFSFNFDYTEIIIGLESSIELWKTPTAVTSLALYGENRILYKSLKYFSKLILGKGAKYKDYGNWIIEPFHLNVMHFYAYFNRIHFLAKAVEDNTGFITSRSGLTPLDVCFEMSNEAGIEFFYKYIAKAAKTDPQFTAVLENSVNRIIRHQSFMCKKFLDLMLNKTLDSTLTRFHHTTVSLPIIVFSPTLFCNKTGFAQESFSNEGQTVEFLQTYFRLNLTLGSQASLDFIKSLLRTENGQVFNSEFIQTVLRLKWRRIRFILYLQATVFIFYMILLSAYADNGDFSVLSACFAVNILLIAYEMVQLLCAGKDYFKGLWNYVDLIGSVLMVLIWIRDLGSLFRVSDNLIALVVFISWVRGISCFRIIERTRYYINLIYEVIWDVIPFLTILVYSTIAFSFIFERLLNGQEEYFSVLKTSWEVNQGGFNTSGYGYWMYLAFVADCVINPIIILNLLISIMADTFRRVNKNVVVADSKELAEMILEAELLYFWKREQGSLSFLHLCKSLKTVTQENEIEKIKLKFGALTKTITKIQEEIAAVRKIQIATKELIAKMNKH